jgi:hypothetical protein
MAQIQKVNIFSFARFQALLFALLGLIAGVVYSFGGLAVDTLVSAGLVISSETPGLSFGTVLAFGALVGMPLIGATIGLAVGCAEALLYNVYAKWSGGVELDCE